MKPIQDWEGIFDRRRAGYEIVSSLKDWFDRIDGNNGGVQFDENCMGSTETLT